MRHIAVFGASSGIGLAAARLLSKYHRVTAYSRTGRAEAGDVANVSWRVCDIRDGDQVENTLRQLAQPIDGVVNCVGVGYYAPPETRYAAYWHEITETNIGGALNLMAAVLAQAPSCETFVGVGSLAARRASSTPGNDVYAASKAAFERLHADFRLRLRQADNAMRVTVVSPGFVAGTTFGKTFFKSNPSCKSDLYSRFEPLTPSDVAEAIAWCLEQPPHVEISELVIRPREQPD